MNPKAAKHEGEIKMKEYVLKHGTQQYGMSFEAQRAVEGLMFWIYCKENDKKELRIAEKEIKAKGEKSAYTKEKITALYKSIERENSSIEDIMVRIKSLNIPDWLCNKASEWAKSTDLKKHYTNEFFAGMVIG